jgi:hypothetical protein
MGIDKAPAPQPNVTFTDEKITAVARAMQTEALNFFNPVEHYVGSEAGIRRRKEDPDFDPYDSVELMEELSLESWKILARAALNAAAGD